MALKEGRSKTRWNFFKDAEMDFQFVRTMAAMAERSRNWRMFQCKKKYQKKGYEALIRSLGSNSFFFREPRNTSRQGWQCG